MDIILRYISEWALAILANILSIVLKLILLVTNIIILPFILLGFFRMPKIISGFYHFLEYWINFWYIKLNEKVLGKNLDK